MEHVTYATIVGSLMYAMVCTQPDIAHAVGVLSRYTSTPRKEQWAAVKRLFGYLCGMIVFAISYQRKPETDGKIDVHGFFNFDWIGDLDHRWLTNIYVFKLFGGVVNWMSRRHLVIEMLTIEVEYMEATHASKETGWLHRLCLEIRFK